MTKRYLLTILSLFILALQASAQLERQMQMDRNASNLGAFGTDRGMNGNTSEFGDMQHGSNRMTWGRDTTKHDKVVPIGLFQWTIDERLGNVTPAENNDTVVLHFNNFHNTDGYNGAYNYLANLAAPRQSRIFFDRNDTEKTFLFLRPLSFALTPLKDFRFSNTLSPITNLSYHSAGGSQNGEDRVRAYFASNINKISGIGFKVDYLYGRGFYLSQQNSTLNANFFGYYRGEKYEMHLWTQFGHQKNAENGGIEEDRYISDPQSFPQSYGSRDIPTLLSQAYNRNDFQSYHLTHRYHLGYNNPIELADSLKPKMPNDEELLKALKDSVRQVVKADSVRLVATLDSLRTNWQEKQPIPTEFVPVGSIIHTLHIDNLTHNHYSSYTPANYYKQHYYGDWNDVNDETTGLTIRNTVGLAVKEGFRKWAKMGITAFATHQFDRFTLPSVQADTLSGMQSFTTHDFSVGGQIDKSQGSFLHYNANGEISLIGNYIGAFDIDGRADMNFGITKKDTLQLAAHAFIKNMHPDPYMQHYHSQSAWWDNDLDFEQRYRIEGTLSNKRSKTSLRVGFENISKYTYFAMSNSLMDGPTGSPIDPEKALPGNYKHGVCVRQHDSNIQILSATLKQDFKLGPLNWENEITYQYTADKDKDILPLPALNVYSNLYLLFRVAKVLRVELGADIRYFTKYYAPDYSPAIGQFAVQDKEYPRIEIGNYPIINAYLNLHIKHCRIYVAANHVNAGTGNMFLAPHYPINPMNIRWGVSWNFFN